MRKHPLDEHKEELIKQVNQGYGVTYIAKTIGVLPMRLYRYLKRENIDYRNRDMKPMRDYYKKSC